MSPSATQTIVREGWRLSQADAGLTPELREAVVARVLEAVRGELGAPRRRSRHARTWQVRIGAGSGIEIFIKLLDAPRGFSVIKRLVRGGRASHVARITQHLNDSGFLAPPLLAYGREAAGDREIIVTPRADGDGPLRTLKALRAGAIDRKRAVLRALGAEIARLHRCGFVHGDLTPFNIFFVRAEPPRFVLIDHERTRSLGLIGRRRQALRNLVQLGRFELPGLSATDRFRILAGYTAMLERRDRRIVTRRVNAMLLRRIRRDGVARVEIWAGGRAVT
jgi:lipopolysaccharide kinase (Kdo/WaaP) family protein